MSCQISDAALREYQALKSRAEAQVGYHVRVLQGYGFTMEQTSPGRFTHRLSILGNRVPRAEFLWKLNDALEAESASQVKP